MEANLHLIFLFLQRKRSLDIQFAYWACTSFSESISYNCTVFKFLSCAGERDLAGGAVTRTQLAVQPFVLSVLEERSNLDPVVVASKDA